MGAELITAQALMSHVSFLCAPAQRGRMPGDVGYERASQFVEQQFQAMGLQPLGDNGTYRQTFFMETNRVMSARLEARLPGHGPWRARLGDDFVCRGLTGGGHASGKLTFVGYGTTDGPVDELANVDLRGRVAVAFKYPPPWQNGEQPLPRERARLLRERGARALILVPNPNRDQPDRLGASLMERGEQIPGMPVLVASESAARCLCVNGGETLAARQWQIDERHIPASGPLAGSARIAVETEWNGQGACWNVIGLLPGTDPVLRQEAIVLGAHLDHVGIQGESVIFAGAQDNASGVAALIEAARALREGPALARSVIFVAFGAEEAGILGSRHYADHPPWPLERTKFMLNADCIGAGTGLDLRGRKHHPALLELADRYNAEQVKLPNAKNNHGAGGADAEPFQQAGIPNIYFMTTLPFQHLHMASDTPETLNPPVFQGLAQLFSIMADRLATEPDLGAAD